MPSLAAQSDEWREPLHTILVVEDEVLIRMAVADYLRDCGLQVVEAASAAEAIQVLSEGALPIDLVFSDVQMPGDVNGLGLAQWIRTNQPTVPLLLTSGGAKLADQAREICHEGPVVPKPYDHELILQHLRKLIQ